GATRRRGQLRERCPSHVRCPHRLRCRRTGGTPGQARREVRDVPTAVIDGITTHYDVVGDGPALLMFAPGGFNSRLDNWSNFSVYGRVKPLEHLSQRYRCIVFDRREAGRSGGRLERVTWQSYVAQGK